jgi:hypothetical protein
VIGEVLNLPDPIDRDAGTLACLAAAMNRGAQIFRVHHVDAAWQAVKVHFPLADRYPQALAQQGLASFYLFRSQEWDKSLGPLTELASLSDSDLELKAFGIAGLVVARAHLKETDEARNENSRLDGQMRTLLEERSPQLYDALEAPLVDLDQAGN